MTAPFMDALVEDGVGLRHWAVAAAVAADAHRGVDTVVIDVGDVLVVTELFVITHGGNARQVRAIVDNVEESLKTAGGPSPSYVEGRQGLQWVLLDYGAFIVHVFDAERRSFYKLEQLWADCPEVDWRLP